MAEVAFQSFEDVSETEESAARIAALRSRLKRLKVDGFLIPRADEFQGEYVPASAERLSWLTGFTGSAGLAAVLQDGAALFVDGRYTLQARDQVDTSLVDIVFIKDESPEEYLERNLRDGARLAYDPWLHTGDGVKRLEAAAHKAGASLVPLEENPVDKVWKDRPAAPTGPAQIQSLDHAGQESSEKRALIAEALGDAEAEVFVLTQPDSLAWLLNIRGRDVPHTPFFLAFALIDSTGQVTLFADAKRVPKDVRAHLGNAVAVKPPNALLPEIGRLAKKGKTLSVDASASPAAIVQAISGAGGKIRMLKDPITALKAVKNPAELAGMRAAHIRDGLALTRFLAWLPREAQSGQVDEITAAKALETFRHETNALEDLSFDTISGAGPNGAIVHYRVTERSTRALEEGTLYLVDSGGQYKDGTTDVTRTIAVGTPSQEMRERFTLVLKGHIALALARFPEGTSGAQLDALARMALWRAGLDFDHGTGHGVGAFLSVHEGPQGISPRATVALKPGMILSNEPGYYKEDAYGIRIENLVVVTEPTVPAGGERPMLGFETLTLAPIDRNLIETALLTPEERGWVDTYHARVASLHLPELSGDEATWLREATKPI